MTGCGDDQPSLGGHNLMDVLQGDLRALQMFEQGCHNDGVKGSEIEIELTLLDVSNQELYLAFRLGDPRLNLLLTFRVPVQQNDQFHPCWRIVQNLCVPTTYIENSVSQIFLNP